MAITPAASMMGSAQALGGVYPGQAGLDPASLGSFPGGAAGLDGAVPLGSAQPLAAGADSGVPSTQSLGFEDALAFIDKAAAQESRANSLETAFAQGKNVPLHDVMASAEEAELSLETLAALRDRVLDAVNELTKMQA